MEREFLPYELSLELKELGFDEPCIAWYSDKNIRISGMDGCVVSKPIKNSSFTEDDEFVSAPTFSQAFRFFREKYQIDSWIYPNLNGLYSVSIVRRGVGLGKVSEYQTYPEAELACLKKLIELVKSK